MKLTVFQSDKGDCLLLRGADGTNVLCDGGMRDSYTRHVAPALGRMRERGEPLDLVYVSHIDQDHIAGVLKLLDDEVEWKVYDYQRGAGGNKTFPRPKVPRPPEVRALWHNAFSDQAGANDGALEDALVTTMKASLLRSDGADPEEGPAAFYSGLASSVREALLLRHRIGPGQLDIPVNEPLGGRLMYVRPKSAPIAVGGLEVTVVGPLKEELENLREEWNVWLEKNVEKVRAIREAARRDAEQMGVDEGVALQNALRALGAKLGDREEITTPNLASLMLLVEETTDAGTRSVLLTGDGHGDDVIAGLRAARRLDANDRFHVDVLKMPHHGAESSAEPAFFGQITADHYVFCGDGGHHNPDLHLVEAFIDARAAAPEGPFALWFNSSEAVATRADRGQHMKKLERLVATAAARHPGRVTAHFLQQGSSFDLTL